MDLLAAILVLVALIWGLTWLSAVIVGANNRGLGVCLVSFIANAVLTYCSRFIISDIYVSFLICTPLIGFINSKIFETTFVRGMLISIIYGVLLAYFVIYMRS